MIEITRTGTDCSVPYIIKIVIQNRTCLLLKGWIEVMKLPVIKVVQCLPYNTIRRVFFVLFILFFFPIFDSGPRNNKSTHKNEDF
jgi:hypothetical protein